MLPADEDDRVPDGEARRNDSRMRWAKAVMSSRDQTSSIRMANSSPPETCCRVEGAEATGELRRNPFEQLVTFPVSQAVVHRLEIVEVDEQHRQVGARQADPGQGVLEPVLEERLVGQSGQGVVEGPVLQLVFQADAIGDVAEAPDPTDDGAVHRLWPGRQFHGTPVLELQRVEALTLRMVQELPVPNKK